MPVRLILAAVAAPLLIAAAAVLLNYGTLSPCGILHKEALRDYLAGPAGKARNAGQIHLFDSLAEKTIQAMGPAGCLRELRNVKSFKLRIEKNIQNMMPAFDDAGVPIDADEWLQGGEGVPAGVPIDAADWLRRQ